jgi:hypothetical protein
MQYANEHAARGVAIFSPTFFAKITKEGIGGQGSFCQTATGCQPVAVVYVWTWHWFLQRFDDMHGKLHGLPKKVLKLRCFLHIVKSCQRKTDSCALLFRISIDIVVH